MGRGRRCPLCQGRRQLALARKVHVGPGHTPSTGGEVPQPRKGPESEGYRAGHGVMATDGHMWGTEGEK